MNFDFINTYFDKIYVLTLKRATERQEIFARNFNGMQYSFFIGKDKQDFDTHQLIEQTIYDEVLAKKVHRYSKPMSAGQIGCAWSHCLIYEDILFNHYKRVLILEDDTYPIINNLAHFSAIINELPQDWELVFFDYFGNEKSEPAKKLWYHIQHFFGGLKWNHRMIGNLYPTPISKHVAKAGYHQFTNAYAITTAGAKKLLQLQTPIHFVADHVIPYAITNELLKGYITMPKTFGQDSTGDGKNQFSYVDD